MFRASASLSAATFRILAGLFAMGMGVFFLQRGLLLYLDFGAYPTVQALLALALVFICAGAVSLAAGIRSVEMFERKLLVTISSRGRLNG